MHLGISHQEQVQVDTEAVCRVAVELHDRSWLLWVHHVHHVLPRAFQPAQQSRSDQRNPSNLWPQSHVSGGIRVMFVIQLRKLQAAVARTVFVHMLQCRINARFAGFVHSTAHVSGAPLSCFSISPELKLCVTLSYALLPVSRLIRGCPLSPAPCLQ